jgi:hypothetical protein
LEAYRHAESVGEMPGGPVPLGMGQAVQTVISEPDKSDATLG